MKKACIAVLLLGLGLMARAQEIRVLASLSPDLQTGLFQLQMSVPAPADVQYELRDPDGVPVADASLHFSGSLTTPTDRIPAVLRWSPEAPRLYTLRLQVNGKESLRSIAFYRMEKDLLNGQPVQFKGVTLQRADHSPETFRKLREAHVNTLCDTSLTQRQADSLGFFLQRKAAFPAWSRVNTDSTYTELQHAYQNVSIAPQDITEGLFTIHNRYSFSSLEGLTVRYWVERDGHRRFWWWRRTLQFRTAPQQEESFRVKLPRMRREGTYRIFFEVLQQDRVVARDEAVLKDTPRPWRHAPRGKLEYTEGDTRIVVRGKAVELVLDKTTGHVLSWQKKGNALTEAGWESHYGKPQRAYARKGEGGSVVIILQGPVRESITVYPDGAVKLTSAHPHPGIRFLTRGTAGARCLARRPGEHKRIWENPQPYYSDADWLQLEQFTILGGSPFSFSIRDGREVHVNYQDSLLLLPRKTMFIR